MLDKRGLTQPQQLTLLTSFRFTKEHRNHALARDDDTGKSVVVRHQQILAPSEYTGGPSGPYRFYSAPDLDTSKVSGFATAEQVGLGRNMRLGEFKFFDRTFEAAAAAAGVELVRAYETLPANSICLVYCIPQDLMNDFDDIGDTRKYLDATVTGLTTDAEGPFRPPMNHHDYDADKYYAVVVGSADERAWNPKFDVDACGVEVTPTNIAKRLRSVAFNLRALGLLEKRGDGATARDRVADADAGLAPQNYFSTREQVVRRLDAGARAMRTLAVRSSHSE